MTSFGPWQGEFFRQWVFHGYSQAMRSLDFSLIWRCHWQKKIRAIVKKINSPEGNLFNQPWSSQSELMDLRLRSIRCEGSGYSWTAIDKNKPQSSTNRILLTVIYGRPKIYWQISSMCLLGDFQPISRRSQPTRNHAMKRHLNATPLLKSYSCSRLRQGKGSWPSVLALPRSFFLNLVRQ